MPHRGLIGARKKRVQDYAILKDLREYLEVGSFREVIPTVKAIVKERDDAEDRLNKILQEFNEKKICTTLIRRRGKIERTTKGGVIYFDKRYVGKRVIVWEKKC